MSKIKPRGKVPKTASVDEIIEIKTLIRHPMHSGRMKDKDGKKIPKRIINKFLVKFNGKQVFGMDLEPSISTNPYIAFPFKAKKLELSILNGQMIMEINIICPEK